MKELVLFLCHFIFDTYFGIYFICVLFLPDSVYLFVALPVNLSK